MKNIIAVILLIVISASLYALTIKGIYGNPEINTVKTKYEGSTNPLELSPERGRFAHVMALGEYGRYDLNPKLTELAYPDVGFYKGRFYSYFAPGIAFMASPFYMLGKQYNLAQVFTFSFISLASILAIVFIFLIAREILKLPIWASMLASLIFAFSSTAWSYATTLYQHHLTVLFIVSGFYAAWKFKEINGYHWPKLGKLTASWFWECFVWIAYALAITVDYPNAILMLPVMVYYLINAFSLNETSTTWKINFRTSILWTMTVFILLTGTHLYFNKINFGGWLNLSGELTGYKLLVENNIDPNDPNIEQLIDGLGREKSALGFFSENRIARGFHILTFSSDRGLFLYAPIFILGIIGIIQTLRKNISMEIMILLALILVNVFLYSSWGDPWGGWAYGPRYLIPTMSILALFTAYALAIGPKIILKKLIAVPLLFYSTIIALLGALTTNAVPPKIEAIPLDADWNYFFNAPLIEQERTGSFLFKEYYHNFMTLQEYFLVILLALLAIFLILIFIAPKLEN